MRDGFVDRYGGEQLVFPGVLRALSHLLPEEFPYHTNWKFGVSHPWYYDLYATIDHIVPVSMQGANSLDNWVTTSMRRNLIKSNRSLEDLKWGFISKGDPTGWDGHMHWFIEYVRSRPELRELAWLNSWYQAAVRNHVLDTTRV